MPNTPDSQTTSPDYRQVFDWIGVAEATSFFLITWLGYILVLTSLGFWLGFSISFYYLPISLALSILTLAIVHYDFRIILPSCILSALLVIICTGVAGLYYDLSFDGQVYHIPAVVALAAGWNPLQYDTLAKWNPTYAEIAGADIFIEHYAKGGWYLAAVAYEATGNIEQSKSPNLLLLFIAFITSLSALRRLGLNLAWVISISSIATLNPVAIYQAFTFYLDGQLASLIAILVFLGISYLREPKPKFMIPLLHALLLLSEIKFTGLVYSTLLLLGFFASSYLYNGRPVALRYASATSGVAVLAFGVIGFHPYVTNTINKGHPFFPALGHSSGKNIQWGQAPDDFMKKDRFTKLIMSVFSRSNNQQPQFKTPFAVSRSELLSMTQADTRFAGLGPFYSGALILSLPLLVWLLFSLQNIGQLYMLIALMTLVATLLINPESWWARLAPQLWLMPLLPVIVLALINHKSVIELWAAKLVLTTMLMNASLVLVYNTHYSRARSEEIAAMLHKLSVASYRQPVDIMVSNGYKVIMGIRLADKNIRYYQPQMIECKPTHPYTHIFRTCAL